MQAQQRGCHLCPPNPPNREGGGSGGQGPLPHPLPSPAIRSSPRKAAHGKTIQRKLQVTRLQSPHQVAVDPGQGRLGSRPRSPRIRRGPLRGVPGRTAGPSWRAPRAWRCTRCFEQINSDGSANQPHGRGPEAWGSEALETHRWQGWPCTQTRWLLSGRSTTAPSEAG